MRMARMLIHSLKTLRGQFLAASLLLIVLPVATVLILYFDSSRSLLLEEVTRSNRQSFAREAEALSETGGRMLRVSNLVVADKETIDFLKLDDSWLRDYSLYQRFLNLNVKLANLANFSFYDSAAVMLFDNRGFLFTNWELRDTQRTRARLEATDWARQARQSDGNPRWLVARAGELDLNGLPAEQPMLLLVRAVRENLRAGLGLLLVAYPLPPEIAANGVGSGEADSGLLLLNDNAYAAGNAELYSRLFERASAEADAADSGYVMLREPIPELGWDLVRAVSRDQITRQLDRLLNRTLLWLIVGLPVVMIALYILFMLRLMNPIRGLLRSMHRVGRGDFEPPEPIRGAYELQLLHRNFVRMVANLHDTLARLTEEQRRKEEARLQALQAQIRPHFLLNTLNSIKWSARLSGAEHVSIMINSLGKLLVGAMRQERDTIPLREELEFVRHYVALQNIRYNNEIWLEVRVPEVLMDCAVNKFLIQPLVENSIVHGGKPPIRIMVEAQEVCGELIVTVDDDGVGLSAVPDLREAAPATESASRTFSGIGIANIGERIRLHFGDRYGLRLEPRPGGGARAIVRLPAAREGEEA